MSAKDDFLRTYEGKYGYGARIEDIRKKEFARMKGITYLDHTGCTLYAKSILDRFHEDLMQNVYGNPHSQNPSSQLTTDIIDQVRFRVLEHFNTSAKDYTVVFTSGATGALRLLADSFNWQGKCRDTECHSHFCYLQQNHTSVVGMREVAASNGAHVIPVLEEDIQSARDFCVDSKFLSWSVKVGPPKQDQHQTVINGEEATHSRSKVPGHFPAKEADLIINDCNHHNLFAYPAMCNFSGRKYPLQWIKTIQTRPLKFSCHSSCDSKKYSKNWFVLLDAASHISSSPLDLTSCTADFIPISFYKLFGFPTGLGALLVRNKSAHILRKCYYGGGSVAATISSERFHVARSSVCDRFEDGTLPFLDIIALQHGFDVLQTLTGGMMNITEHTFSLAQYVHHQMSNMKHGNGRLLCELYCNTGFDAINTQGPIISFNLLRSNGDYIGYSQVEKLASLKGIHLRTGCFCNTGACQQHLCITNEQIKSNLLAGHVCGDNVDLINGLPTGAVRVSFGYMSNFHDAQYFLEFVEETFLEECKVCDEERNCLSRQLADGKLCGNNNTREVDDTSTRTSDSVSADIGIANRSDRKNCSSDELGFEASSVNQNSSVVECYRNSCAQKSESEQVDGKPHRGETETTEAITPNHAHSNQVVLERICLYPIKSCAAFEVTEWEIGPRGFLFDRQWMIVSESGYCISQKRESRLCQIRPRVCLDSRVLLVDASGMPTLKVPLEGSEQTSCEATLCQTRVCGDRVSALDCGNEAAAWLTKFLKKSCRLLQQNVSEERICTLKGKEDSGKFSLSLTNESQFLLVSRASAAQLQVWISRGTEQPSVGEHAGVDDLLDRFRSNLIISGVVPFEEDCWTSVSIDDQEFKCQGLCSRCQMVCLDQRNGTRSAEPLRTLGKTRGPKIPFGVHLVHSPTDKPCKLRCGAVVTIKKPQEGRG